MMTHWQKRTLWTTCLLATASAGICIAQQGLQLHPLGDAPTFDANTPPPLSDAPTSSANTPNARSNAEAVLTPVSDEAKTVQVRYVIERPVVESVRQGGKVIKVTRYVKEVQSSQMDLDTNLDELDLPPDGKRAAVLAVTAARHEDLLQKLKAAEDDEEKTKEAAEALKTNYTEHYAIETWWREQRLAELEKRLKEMRDQVQQRQAAQEKYVEAAMTIAELWAQGIAIAPPKPGSAPEHGPMALPVPAATVAPSTGGAWSPAPYTESQPSPTLPPRLVPRTEATTPVYDTPAKSRK